MKTLMNAIYQMLPTRAESAQSTALLTERLHHHHALINCKGQKTRLQKIRRQLEKLELDKAGKIHIVQHGKELRYWKSSEPEAQLSQLLQQLNLLQDVIRQRLPSSLQQQLNDLMQQVPSNKGNWLRKIYIAPSSVWQPPKLNPDVTAVIYQAIENDLTFSCDYTTLKGVTKRVTLVPWGLMTKAEKVYVLAIERGSVKPAPVTYALLSMQNAVLGDNQTLREGLPADTDLKTYCELHHIGSFGAGSEQISLIVRFYGIAAKRLADTPLSDDMQINELTHDCREVTATVRDTKELRKFLLGFGALAEVIAPAQLRDDIKNELKACLRRYD